MQYSLLKCFLTGMVTMSFISAAVSCEKSRWFRNVQFDDVEITDNILSTSSVLTKWMCADKCKQEPKCASFSYNNDGTCRLYSIMFGSNQSSSPATGWTYYNYDTGECDVTNGYALLPNLRFCVKAFAGDKTFYDANDTCSQLGDRLVVFDTTEKTMALMTYLAHSGVQTFLVGLTDLQTEGEFVWVDGRVATNLTWGEGEPNNYGGKEDCVQLVWERSAIVDTNCSYKKPYICEKLL